MHAQDIDWMEVKSNLNSAKIIDQKWLTLSGLLEETNNTTFMQPPLTESQRTEQPSLWTCCQLLEEPWDFSLDSQSSVEWRFCTLLSR